MIKRLFDLAFAAIGLIVLALPMILIALIIRFDSRGPVFFRQERVGRHGVPFRIHKFRTMAHQRVQAGPQITVGADARITRVGRFLRASKLDELPQLIDVLQGTMSFVGPRPEVPHYVAMYPSALREKILSVRPGITDPASLSMRNEADVLARAADSQREYIEVIMPAKLQAAARYIDEASLLGDIKLIMSTVFHIARRG